MGKPISTERLLRATGVPAELVRKLAVTVDVFPGPTAVGQIGVGDAVALSTKNGTDVRVPAPPIPTIAALSQVPAAAGPVLQPHQLLVASTLPAELFIASPSGLMVEVLFTIRL